MTQPNDRAVELRLRAAIDSAPSGLLMIDATGRIVLVNREVERLFGYAREELLGQSVELVVPEASRHRHEADRAAFMAQPSVRAMGVGRDLFGRRKDGTEVPIEVGLTPLVTDEGLFVLSSIVDLTARRRAEERFRAAVESAPSGMVMVDGAGRIVLVNREVERLFGWTREELLGRPVEDLVPERSRRAHPGFRRGFHDAPQARPMGVGRELFGLRKDGTEVPIEIGLNPIQTEEGLFVLSSIVDISARVQAETARRQLEERLRQAQKMEAVGTLAGGIAHDFNNILNSVLGYAELALAGAGTPQLRADLSEIQVAARRGRDLVSAILRFSRHEPAQRRPADLREVVQEAVRLLRPTLPTTIRIVTRQDAAAPRILADPTELQQVLMNLATNAAHAMPDGGTLELALEDFYARDHFVRTHPELREGAHVVLAVRDTGAGMDEVTRARAFEPFFTTKAAGQGSGLGLAMVHGIVRAHEGTVVIESEPGAGTTVRCYFPLLAAELPGATAVEDDVPMGAGEHVLVVDDEPSLSRLGERRLLDLGYRATALTDPRQALAVALAGEVDLVLTDFTMPQMTGLELARRLAEAGRATPVIMVSGHPSELGPEQLAGTHVRLVLRKPVSHAELAGALRRVLAPG